MSIFPALLLLSANDSDRNSPVRKRSERQGRVCVWVRRSFQLPRRTPNESQPHVFRLFPEPLGWAIFSPSPVTALGFLPQELPHSLPSLLFFPPTALLFSLQLLCTCSTPPYPFSPLKTESTELTDTVMFFFFLFFLFFFFPSPCRSYRSGALLLASVAGARVLGCHGNSQSNQPGPSQARSCHGEEEASTSRPRARMGREHRNSSPGRAHSAPGTETVHQTPSRTAPQGTAPSIPRLPPSQPDA